MVFKQFQNFLINGNYKRNRPNIIRCPIKPFAGRSCSFAILLNRFLQLKSYTNNANENISECLIQYETKYYIEYICDRDIFPSGLYRFMERVRNSFILLSNVGFIIYIILLVYDSLLQNIYFTSHSYIICEKCKIGSRLARWRV